MDIKEIPPAKNTKIHHFHSYETLSAADTREAVQKNYAE